MNTTKLLHLPVKLTGKELLMKGTELVKVLGERDDLEDEKKALTKQLAEDIKEKNELARSIARTVRCQTEDRPVECSEVFRYSDMMVDTMRLDTGDVVSSRPMNPSERQEAIKFEQSDELKQDFPDAAEKKNGKRTKKRAVVDQAEHEDAH